MEAIQFKDMREEDQESFIDFLCDRIANLEEELSVLGEEHYIEYLDDEEYNDEYIQTLTAEIEDLTDRLKYSDKINLANLWKIKELMVELEDQEKKLDDLEEQIEYGVKELEKQIEELQARNDRQVVMIEELQEWEQDDYMYHWECAGANGNFELEEGFWKTTISYTGWTWTTERTESNYNIVSNDNVIWEISTIETKNGKFPFIKINIDEKHRRKWYWKAAVKLLLEENKLGVDWYYATIAYRNTASLALFEWLGFQPLSTRVQEWLRHSGLLTQTQRRFFIYLK